METFDDGNQGTKMAFVYGNYGRLKNIYEYGYKVGMEYKVRRRTFNRYLDG